MGVCDGGAWLARLRSRGEKAGGVGARGCVRACKYVEAGRHVGR